MKMKKLLSRFKNLCRKLTAAVFPLCIILSAMPYAMATDDIGSSKIATGTKKLIEDATTLLLIIAPIAGTLCIIYFAIRRSAADEQEQKQWNNRIITAIVSVLVAVLASVIIKVITAYYK